MGTCCASAVDQDLDVNKLVSDSSSDYEYEEETFDSCSGGEEAKIEEEEKEERMEMEVRLDMEEQNSWKFR